LENPWPLEVSFWTISGKLFPFMIAKGGSLAVERDKVQLQKMANTL
jgi:hypothetical protein